MAALIPLSEIVDNPFQPRKSFDRGDLSAFAKEIAAEGYWNGSLQGRRTKGGKIELVFGHRRLRALRLLKVPSVKVDVLTLTDTQMALRALEENLQREGLTDLEKADAVKRAVELLQHEREAAGKPTRGVIQEVADRLGLGHQWISNLCDISASMDAEARAPIEAGHLSAKTALAAKDWGGETYVRTLAKQGKAASTGKVAKPTHMTVAAMKKAVRAAPEAVQEKLKKAIVAGQVTTAAEAEKRGRALAATRIRHEKPAPQDLKVVIVGWTHRLTDWEKEMGEVAPYMEYVEEAPAIAREFRAALKKLIKTAERLL